MRSMTAPIALLFLLCSCNTVQAVQDLPADFWINCEQLLYAVWQDITSLIDLML